MMDITRWYAIALGGLVSLAILFCLSLAITGIVRTYATTLFLKHVFYPQLPRYLTGSGKTTRFDAALIAVFLVGNILCLCVKITDTSGLVRRSGLMSTINIIPLSLGAHMNLIASGCGVRLDSYALMHRWLGRVAIVEALIHTVAAAISHPLNFKKASDIAALTACITIAVILLSSIGYIRRHFYEIFSKAHLVLVAIALAAIYVHTPSKNPLTVPKVYLLVAVCLQVAMGSVRLGQVLYRNIRYRKLWSPVSVRTIHFKRPYGRDIPVSDAVHVHVRPRRPWKPQAGQYVYLRVGGVSRTSFAQSHPFYVPWWYQDEDGNVVVVLIVQKRKGFTERLFLQAGSGFTREPELEALVEGPYGRELDLESYGTVLLFATGIGIAGQLPYVTQLLEGYHDCKVKTRRIALFWELDSELHAAWVADMMKELLRRDTKRILDIRLFILGNFLSNETHLGDNARPGERIDMTYKPMDAEDLIESEMEGRKGRTVVSLCTNDERSNEIREIVRRLLDKDIHLKELEFRPPPASEYKKDRKGLFTADRSKRMIEKV